ncbi:transposase [Nitrosomonas sp. Nm34]|uniref:transposase n=1 Tax=Nitrosomonas sp. Nm34 TaxID=1881055 RepID=UPI00158722DF|nr:transposase [Nitrosomonas sp. Nm34]
MVKEIQKRSLQKRYRLPKLAKVKRIAIDEIYQGNKLGYLAIVLDLQRGAVIFVGNGKGADALLPFWKRLKRSCAHIEVIATDDIWAQLTSGQYRVIFQRLRWYSIIFMSSNCLMKN